MLFIYDTQYQNLKSHRSTSNRQVIDVKIDNLQPISWLQDHSALG